MSNTATTATPPGKPLHLQIAHQLQQEIGGKIFPPGSCLPSEKEIAVRFGVAPMTVRQALSLLEDRGMILRRRGKKTEVTSALEKVTLGILFGPSLTEETAYFYRAVLSAFREHALERNWTLKVFDALQLRSAELHPQRNAILGQLVHEVKGYGINGTIQISIQKQDIVGVLPQSIPSVGVSAATMADINLDAWQFGYAAIKDHFLHGRKRICYIRTRFADESATGAIQADLDGMAAAAAELNIPAPTICNLVVDVSMGASSERLHRLVVEIFTRWKSLPEEQRPNALIVSDDVMMRIVSMALAEAGLCTSDELRIIVSTHDRADFYYMVKVHRFAYPIGELVRQTFDLLESRMQGTNDPNLPIRIHGGFTPQST